MSIKVSIIIPTYHDWKRLAICLDALEKQTFPKEEFEILVVNNDPKDPTPANFYLPQNCEGKPGSYSARNTALKLVKGEIIGFTDSDCIPDKDWITNAILLFKKHPECTRIAGHIELFFKSDKLTLAEMYEKVYAFRQDFAAKVGASVTGNMFAYKKLLDEVGDFNETLMSGGDYEWSMRAKALHSKIMYGADVVLQHPARHELDELIKKTKRLGSFYGKSKIRSLFRLCKYLIPPFNTFADAKNKLPFDQQIKVMYVRYFLNLTRSMEEVKIAFGKNANRE
jgi:glycosyltransferase involved in cell wall biosynthesis